MRIFWRTLPVMLLPGVAALAQFPDKFTNLQVLPKTISSQDLMNTMRGFSFALGARCEFCHADDHRFAADEKPAKATARLMLRMVGTINREYVGKVPGATAVVECVTCHHGLTRPRTLVAVLTESLDQKGIPATIALYRDLRKEYAATGAYDFSETSLNILCESLNHDKKFQEALAIMELNAEANAPLSGWGYGVFAMAHQGAGQRAKAQEDFKKIMELEPNNDWARRQFEEIQKENP